MIQRHALLAAALLFAILVVNIVVGKIAVLQGATTVPGVGDVGEFLLLLASVVLFIVACLARERERDEQQAQQDSD